MTANSEGPTVQGEAFEIVSVPIPGESTNMTIEAETATEGESVRDVFAYMQREDLTVIQLLPAHALAQQIVDRKVKRAEQIDDAPIELEWNWYWYATVLDIEGRDVTGTNTDAFWSELVSSLGLAHRRQLKAIPNAATRAGDFLVISHGEFIPVTKMDDDTYELVSHDEWRRQERARLNSFADNRPVIRESKPSWAESTDVDAVDPQTHEADIVYGRSFGPVELSRAAVYADGVMQFDDDTDRPFVTLTKHEDLTLEEMRELASALMAAIPVVEEATE